MLASRRLTMHGTPWSAEPRDSSLVSRRCPPSRSWNRSSQAVGRERVVFSLDLRDGQPIATTPELAQQSPEDLAARAAAAGVSAMLMLDLARVGSGSGVDLELLARIRSRVSTVPLYVGGGVRSIGDVEQLRRVGCDGALSPQRFSTGRSRSATSTLTFAFDLTMSATLGWDIGGVNTKVARVTGGTVLAVGSRPFELQHDPGALVQVLRELAAETGGSGADTHARDDDRGAVADVSDQARWRAFVLDAVVAAFPGATIVVYAVDGRFLTRGGGVHAPLLVAAANWGATARIVAQSLPDALLVDIGTTSTDIIPIIDGEVAALGSTDPDRLASGELVYTGAVRTPVEAMAAVRVARGQRGGAFCGGICAER